MDGVDRGFKQNQAIGWQADTSLYYSCSNLFWLATNVVMRPLE
jgi:hypothetical protein